MAVHDDFTFATKGQPMDHQCPVQVSDPLFITQRENMYRTNYEPGNAEHSLLLVGKRIN